MPSPSASARPAGRTDPPVAMPVPLPIDPLTPRILEVLEQSNSLVLEAPPGAGKTTRVPPALLRSLTGEVLVLEPRRLAARLAARRVAFELGEKAGETAGYQVRFEDVTGPKTRLRFLTEGVLTRRLLTDSRLEGVSAVVLDEFHERHLDGDLALALLRRLQSAARPNLRLLVMSATMDSAPVSRFLGGCPVMRAEGRLYDLSISYTASSPEPLADQVARALEGLLRQGLTGHVLVFLPGAAEIRQAGRACAGIAQRAGLLLLPLHGDLSAEEQDRAVAPSGGRKVILSTNVAESSVTIDGVTAVIDSGLARVAAFSPWSGLPSLSVQRISQASAAQRAGRAGRTGPGRVIRLYPAVDFHRRPAQDTPEIERRELSEISLHLKAMGLGLGGLDWLDRPPEAAVTAAEQLLRDLGAAGRAGRLTETGRRMIPYALHPRLARLVLESAARGVAAEGCALAAILSSGRRRAGPSELLHLLDRELDPVERKVYRQILRDGQLRLSRRERGPSAATDDALRISALAAFPDRVAKRRHGGELLLAAGGSAVLAQGGAPEGEWFIAVDIEERRERGLPLVRLASAIRPEWLLDLFPERVTTRSTVEWNRKAERVEAAEALLYLGLILEENRQAAPEAGQAAALLAGKALEAGLGRFTDLAELGEFQARVEFAAAHSALTALREEDLRAALEALCRGRRSFAELREAAAHPRFVRALAGRLPAEAGRLLREVAPERIELPGGRHVRVRYARNQTPWVASRLQDFFGMRETPKIARGAVPLVVHLLAPNQRPVQTTTDLAGFWARLYPQVRRELSRRYPKHAWPEDPVRVG
ncbi:MAG: ATP-dependent helicase HrpB [Bryobacterales bacterium]|nr:ATP-dependent helicase HrpB [Bryobacterales bacterium]